MASPAAAILRSLMIWFAFIVAVTGGLECYVCTNNAGFGLLSDTCDKPDSSTTPIEGGDCQWCSLHYESAKMDGEFDSVNVCIFFCEKIGATFVVECRSVSVLFLFTFSRLFGSSSPIARVRV